MKTETFSVTLEEFKGMALELLQALPSMTRADQARGGLKALGLAYLGLRESCPSDRPLSVGIYEYVAPKALAREIELSLP